MTDAVDHFELDRDEPAYPRAITVADNAVALHHAVTVRQPQPRALERPGLRVVISVEDPNHLATCKMERRIHVLERLLNLPLVVMSYNRLDPAVGLLRKFAETLSNER